MQPEAVKRFFRMYPDEKECFEIYNGSVFATEESARKSIQRCTAKRVTRYQRETAPKAKKKD